MTRWLVARAFHALLTLAVAICILFFLMRIIPGDPLSRLSDDRPIAPREIARLRERYGLDQPVLRQFARFAGGAARGDLGTSIEYGRPVTGSSPNGSPPPCCSAARCCSSTSRSASGSACARRCGGAAAVDRWLDVASRSPGYAMPSFWLGLLLAWLAAITGGCSRRPACTTCCSPEAGRTGRDHHRRAPSPPSPGAHPLARQHRRHDALSARGHARGTRVPLRADRARQGHQRARVIWRHAWRNALFPGGHTVRTLAPPAGHRFGVRRGRVRLARARHPGRGRRRAAATIRCSWARPLLVTALVVLGGLLTDVAYALLDPAGAPLVTPRTRARRAPGATRAAGRAARPARCRRCSPPRRPAGCFPIRWRSPTSRPGEPPAGPGAPVRHRPVEPGRAGPGRAGARASRSPSPPRGRAVHHARRTVGLVAGYRGGAVDAVLMRLVDGALAIPRLFLLLLVLAVGSGFRCRRSSSLIGATGWFGTSRLVRAEVLRLRERELRPRRPRRSARRGGGLCFSICCPMPLGPLLVAATLGVGDVILLEAGLSFLGLGIQPPTPSWGGMILDAREVLVSAPWAGIFPGLAIVLTVSPPTCSATPCATPSIPEAHDRECSRCSDLRVSFPGAAGRIVLSGGRRQLLARARRDARAGRRIRLRQESDQPGPAAAGAAARADRARQPRAPGRHRRARAPRARRCARSAGAGSG